MNPVSHEDIIAFISPGEAVGQQNDSLHSRFAHGFRFVHLIIEVICDMARCDNGDSARSEFYAGPREIKALPQAEEKHFARLADGEETGNAALDIPVWESPDDSPTLSPHRPQVR